MSSYIDQLFRDIKLTSMQFGMSDDTAREFASAMVERIQHQHSGHVYIAQPSKQSRNERIRRMFNGVNHDAVCAQFDISKSTLYRIIKDAK